MASSGIQTLPVLLSGLIASSLDDDRDEATASPYVIKNTFIDVQEDDFMASPSLRRSASAPPVFKQTERQISELDGLATNEPVTTPRCPTECSLQLCSTESTCALTDEDDTYPENDSGVSDTLSVVSSSECLALSLVDLVAPPPRTALTSKAKAWSPGSAKTLGADGGFRPPPAPPPLAPAAIQQGFAGVAAAAQLALERCAGVERVAHDASPVAELSLRAVSQPQHPLQAQHTLAVAKQAMLSAAEQSNGVYVVGYEVQPFVPSASGLGFGARLAYVEDEGAACWDFLARGFCNRCCACRWRHPSFITRVSVSLDCPPVRS
eukprot:TRINITY_DN47803_c0_g1_i1.p1 TRINITY_DN47803_c0_g1~~TRINITY_DN47803_c0_g1_i1.p1  ORF type:complete len:322 (-),score=81.18 TRINITY_DN47803_c0_g1_i1:27-992(-)